MSRRNAAEKRKVIPDPVHHSEELARFINQIMVDGKKSIAEKAVYGAFEIILAKTKKDPLDIFKQAIANVQPAIEVKSRRVGGATYQVPIEVRPTRARTLAMRWLVDFSRKRGEKGFAARLAGEILDAADDESTGGTGRGKGGAVKKREDTHRMADANRAFSHFRW
jgi:small subunit ribosomal protein S7